MQFQHQRGQSDRALPRGVRVDNVNDPAYNMKNVIKQAILLEEHLADDKKYCKPCSVKHFCHIIGLLEEASWMACGQEYPLLNDCLESFSSWFEEWQKSMSDKAIRNNILTDMRKMRQNLIAAYYLQGPVSSSVCSASVDSGVCGGEATPSPIDSKNRRMVWRT
jgi:hypothetical protein